MRTFVFRLSGTATEGDVLVLCTSSPRGGQSSAQYWVKGDKTTAFINEAGEAERKFSPGDTPAAMAEGLAEVINRSTEFFTEHLHATPKGDLLLLACSDIYSDVTWIPQVRGVGTEIIEEL